MDYIGLLGRAKKNRWSVILDGERSLNSQEHGCSATEAARMAGADVREGKVGSGATCLCLAPRTRGHVPSLRTKKYVYINMPVCVVRSARLIVT